MQIEAVCMELMLPARVALQLRHQATHSKQKRKQVQVTRQRTVT